MEEQKAFYTTRYELGTSTFPLVKDYDALGPLKRSPVVGITGWKTTVIDEVLSRGTGSARVPSGRDLENPNLGFSY